MEGLITIGIFVAIYFFVATNGKKARRTGQSKQQEHNENFPFPWLDNEEYNMPEPPQYGDFHQREQLTDELYIPAAADEIETQAVPSTTTRPLGPTITADEPIHINKVPKRNSGFKDRFNMRDAVVFSEILKPKF